MKVNEIVFLTILGIVALEFIWGVIPMKKGEDIIIGFPPIIVLKISIPLVINQTI